LSNSLALSVFSPCAFSPLLLTAGAPTGCSLKRCSFFFSFLCVLRRRNKRPGIPFFCLTRRWPPRLAPNRPLFLYSGKNVSGPFAGGFLKGRTKACFRRPAAPLFLLISVVFCAKIPFMSEPLGFCCLVFVVFFFFFFFFFFFLFPSRGGSTQVGVFFLEFATLRPFDPGLAPQEVFSLRSDGRKDFLASGSLFSLF